MSLSPVIGTDVPESANGVATLVSSELNSENGPHTHYTHTQSLLNIGGSREPCSGHGSDDGTISETENSIDGDRSECDGKESSENDKEKRSQTALLHSTYALDPSLPVGTCTGDTDSVTSAKCTEAPLGRSALLESPVRANSQPAETSPVYCSVESGSKEMAREEEEEEEEEKDDREKYTTKSADIKLTPHSSSPPPGPSLASGNPPPPPAQASVSSPCPPHIMAQVRVRNVSERERIVRGMQDSKSLDEISQACGGNVGSRGGGRGGQPEGRRATISSALELEGTVSQDGDLTVFICKNLEQKIKMSSKPSLDCSDSNCSGPSVRGRSSSRRPADIPPIDPDVVLDLKRHTQEVAHSVEMMMRSLNGTIQNMTALSVGYIQTYRDSVDSLGESVDMSIKGMYTLMARCEELDRSMQPIHTLATQIRDIKRTLDALEAICK